MKERLQEETISKHPDQWYFKAGSNINVTRITMSDSQVDELLSLVVYDNSYNLAIN